MCGINDDRTQKCLLTEEDLALARAVMLAKGRKAAEISAQQCKEPEHTVKSIGATTRRKETCLHCGSESHVSDKCHFNQVTCHKCGKVRYLARVCRSQGLKVRASSQWVQYANHNEKVGGLLYL